MYEIIMLIVLSLKIGHLAEKKRVSVWQWRVYNILAFLAGDFIGGIIGFSIYGMQRWYMVILIVIPMSLMGYHITRTMLQNLPDQHNHNIN